MKYALDTDIISYFLKGSEKNVIKKFEKTNPDDICTTIVNYSELLFGIYHKYTTRSRVFKAVNNFLESLPIVNIDKESAKTFALLKTKLTKKGKRLADLDLIIASICISNNLTLVTHNTKHFAKISGLEQEDWV